VPRGWEAVAWDTQEAQAAACEAGWAPVAGLAGEGRNTILKGENRLV